VNQEALVAVVLSLGAAIAGFMGGRRNGALATETITLLKSQLDELRYKCEQIPVLQERIVVLEEMVTQRAKVDEVLEIVTEIREKMDAT
jgi:hypothetical protein